MRTLHSKLSQTFTPARIAMGVVLLLGIALRLIWPSDIEYKGDEKYVFDTVTSVLHGGAWPTLGMSSGVALRNPGMSVWAFIGLGWFTGASSPVVLAQAVQWSNIFALIALCIFILRNIPDEEREAWFWGAALVCLNPFDVLLQRKIWAPSLFPLLSVILLWGWWHRRKITGAFTWGFVGALIGQLQMGGGFFLPLAFLIGTLVAKGRREVRWFAWLAGSVIGAIPLVPWLLYVLEQLKTGLPSSYHSFYVEFSLKVHPISSWIDQIPGQFWWLWTTGIAGFGLDYSLHHEIWNFFAWPEIGGQSTYLAAVFTVLSTGVVLVALVRYLLLCWKKWGMIRARDPQSPLDLHAHRDTTLVVTIVFFWFGLIFTASPFFMHRHYLLVAFPFQGIWLARLALARGQAKKVGRVLLGTLCAALFCLSVLFLGYIHSHGGAPSGDYGVAYSAQN